MSTHREGWLLEKWVEQETATSCQWCEKSLLEDGLCYPYRSKHNDAICHDCWRDNCAFDCCLCAETEDEKYQGAIGSLIVIGDDEGEELPTGLYRVDAHPYYFAGVVGEGGFFSSAITRVGDMPKGVNLDGYPAGHLCRSCAKKVVEPQAVTP